MYHCITKGRSVYLTRAALAAYPVMYVMIAVRQAIIDFCKFSNRIVLIEVVAYL